MAGKITRISIVVFINIVLFSALHFMVQAATLVVTNTNDSGSGSLRQAIIDANPGDVITFDSSLSGQTIVLGSELVLTKSLAISSTIPITISGNNSVRVFDVTTSSAITLTGLTIANGSISGNGGGLYNANGSTITIKDSTFSHNIAYNGGGIFNTSSGEVTLVNSVVSGNRSTYYDGGGIYNDTGSKLVVNESTIKGNAAANGSGGGIFDDGGSTVVNGTTVYGNSAAIEGGGFFLLNGSVAKLTNTTISGNTASEGGGISNGSSASIVMTYTTVTGNTASSNGGGIQNQYYGIVTLRNSIVANSLSGGDCWVYNAAFTSNGYNLAGDSSCTAFTNTGDITNTNPLLGPLQDNGGPAAGVNGEQPMLTHALLVGSPALNAADCLSSPTTDQRGYPRPNLPSLASFCDIGAYEAALSLEKTVNAAIVNPGQNLTYTLNYAYVGLGLAQDVVITDTIPPSLTNVTVVSSGAAITDTGTVPGYVWHTQDLLPGQGGIITITGKLDNATPIGPLSNNAIIYATLEDGNPGDATASVNTTVEPASDLTVGIVDSPDPVIAGKPLTYVTTVTNHGPNAATGVVVTDTLPSGVSGAVTTGCAGDPAGVPSCSLGTIFAGSSSAYTTTVMVDANITGTITNTIQVGATNTLINTGDDSASVATTVNALADLSLNKLVSGPTTIMTDTVSVSTSSVVTFTLVVNNVGPSTAAAGAQVSDQLPAGLTFDGFVSATAGDFSNTGNQVSWTNLPAFSPGATTQTLIYRARVDANTIGQSMQNAAQLTATQQTDPDGSNNSSSATVIVNVMHLYFPFFPH